MKTKIFLMILLTCLSVAAGQVTILWDANPEPDITGYKVYIGTESRNYSETIQVIDGTSVSLDTFVEGITYFCNVTAYNFAGLESDFSEELVFTVPLSPPSNLKIK